VSESEDIADTSEDSTADPEPTYYTTSQGVHFELFDISDSSFNEMKNRIAQRDAGEAENESPSSFGNWNLVEFEYQDHELDLRHPDLGYLPNNNYAAFIEGYFVPPIDGDYTKEWVVKVNNYHED
jgi:hypothetical protein